MLILLSLSKDDLHYFQVKHFHPPSTSSSDQAEHKGFTLSEDVIPTQNGFLNDDQDLANEEDGTYFEDDDGLGYYPDGVKRTLTDEQIAMFRHSEIYSLFRKKQIQDEAADVDENIQSGPLNVGSISNSPTKIEQGLDSGPGEDNDEDEYRKFLVEEGKQMEADRKQMEAEHKSKKRKLGQFNGSKSHDRAPTHRRIARELDDAIASHDVLNYDDENAETRDLPGIPPHDSEGNSSKSRRLISEAAKPVLTTTATSPYDPPKGRKIWWPAIGKAAETVP